MSNTIAPPSADGPLLKTLDLDEVNFTPGERSLVLWITTDRVDHEGDVVVASGVDFKSVYLPDDEARRNPVVLAFHDLGRWPIGRCEWIKARRKSGFFGLVAKATFDDDEDSLRIWRKVQQRTVRAASIGFGKPVDMKPGEWGPPTAEELRRRPDWKGARRIVRRCVLIEFSIVPVPMNPDCLTVAIAKGLHRPEPSMDHDDEHEDERKDAEPGADEPIIDSKAKVTEPDPDDDGDDDADAGGDDDADMPIHRGDHVRVVKGTHKGLCGKAVSAHRGEMVPDVEDDVYGTRESPALKVRAYKRMGDGHAPTDHHVGCKMEHCEKIDELRPPKAGRRKGLAAHPPHLDLPPLDDALSDAEVEARRTAAYRAALTPATIKAIVTEIRAERLGAV